MSLTFRFGATMVLILTHPSSLDHVTPRGHPERVDRYRAVERALKGLETHEAPVGERTDILRCHPERYIARIEAAIPEEGFRSLDADTHVSPGSLEPALRAVGGCCAAVDAVVTGEARRAFVAMRPPGHHAETETAMGFCLFGNVAIAAKRALDVHGQDRVAIVDFDVHHGNGTQDLLWDEPRALFVSSHQMPLYPGTGARSERGAHDNVLNLPLDPGTDGRAMRQVYEAEVLPAVRDFAPDLILISAGFDAHRNDPLASLNWETEDFAWVTQALVELSEEVCGGRIVSSLEGGYDLAALEASVAAHVVAL